MAARFGETQPLKNIQVKLSGREGSALPWSEWDTVRTNGDGEFTVSRNKSCVDRYCSRSSSRMTRSSCATRDPLRRSPFGSLHTVGPDAPEERERSRAFRSPWLEQLDPLAPLHRLRGELETDIAIVGAGIAGIATAYFCLRDTNRRVALIERTRVGHGASGRNAGQLVTYFERPLCDIADEFGIGMAAQAQADVDAAWALLDEMLAETGVEVPIERLEGAMGMFTLNHLQVHLRNQRIRQAAGLVTERVEVSKEAPFLAEIPGEYNDLYIVVPQARIRAVMEIDCDTYTAVLISRKGCANSALLCQRVLQVLLARHGREFVHFDGTTVDRLVLEAGAARLEAGCGAITAENVVLCTNGFTHLVIENPSGPAIGRYAGGLEESVIGYMAAFTGPPGRPAGATNYILNDRMDGALPYYYLTRRPYAVAERAVTLTCLGGPEAVIEDTDAYDGDADMPQDVLHEFDGRVRSACVPHRAPGLPYEYTWHGLMGYTAGKIRRVGFEPRNPVLLYNLGCNGVGILPSIAGGYRIARLLRGERLRPSLFDPI